jgi:thiol-disulfide isomerase/thioredoxin
VGRRRERVDIGPPDRLIDPEELDNQPGEPTSHEPDPFVGAIGSSPERPRPARSAIIAASVLVAGVGLLYIGGNEFRTRGTQGIGGLSPVDRAAQAEVSGGTAPAIELPPVVGSGVVSLQALRGHVVVVNFWASWCGPCRTEAPDLQRSWSRYSTQGVRFVGVDERDNQAGAASFMEEFHIGYPSAFDPSGSLADDFRIQGLPTTVVLDERGEIRYRFIGILDRSTLDAAIDDVLGSNGTDGS